MYIGLYYRHSRRLMLARQELQHTAMSTRATGGIGVAKYLLAFEQPHLSTGYQSGSCSSKSQRKFLADRPRRAFCYGLPVVSIDSTTLDVPD